MPLSLFRIALILAILCIPMLHGQIRAQLPWTEDFETYNEGATDGTGTPPRWTSTPPGGETYFEVRDNGNKEFVGLYLTDVAIWETEFIDISSYPNVYISVDIKESGVLDATWDTIQLYYQINDSTEVLWHKEDDDFSESYITVSVGNLSGDSIKLIIRSRNGDTDEAYYFDNIVIDEPDTIFSVSSGNWDASIWHNARAGGPTLSDPSSTYIVVIQNGHTVNLNTDIDVSNLIIEDGGKLQWTASNLDLSLVSNGRLNVQDGGSLTRNGYSGANIVVDELWKSASIIADSTIRISSIELANFQGQLDLTGSAPIILSGDFGINGDGTGFNTKFGYAANITVDNNTNLT
jgi:hypothetical protein